MSTTASFIVTLSLAPSDLQRLDALADDIHNSCEADGMAVQSVAPYAHPTIPSASAQMGLTPPIQPPQL